MVEDSPGDIRLFREFLNDAATAPHLATVPDGVQAMAYLRREGRYAGAPRPDLILLDLNLPGKHGIEVLEEIKQDPRLRRVPVIVLTTSASPQDIQTTYNHHANCYIVKPADLERYIQVVHAIEQFWLDTVELPSEECA